MGRWLARAHAMAAGATIEPMPERAARLATHAESDELKVLIRAILTDAPDEWDEVHRIACADPEAALTSFRLLAAEAREL